MLIKNSIYNLLGLGLPLLVAVYAIPELIESLGADQFGILTIIWAVVSYFSLFDLGFGRALTQKLSFYLGCKKSDQIAPLITTAITCLLIMSIVAGMLLILAAPLFEKIESGVSSEELFSTLLAMSIAMPAVILTAGFRGILESLDKFKIINLIRLPMGIFTFIGPLIAISLFGPFISAVAWILVLGRYVTLFAHMFFCHRYLKVNYKISNFDKRELNLLLRSGGWMTVSNIISPLMSYIDRFLIGASISTTSVAYYVTPQELLTKLAIIPTALTSVLFPSLAKNINDKKKQQHLYYISLSIIFIVVAPVILFFTIFAKEILTIWINEDFAESSYRVMEILSIGMLFTCIAQVPFTTIQSLGFAKYTAKLHLWEFPFYIVTVILMSESLGIVGVAIAWSLRNIIDAIILFYIEFKIRNKNSWVG